MTVRDIENAAGLTKSPLSDKLSDFALIFGAFEAFVPGNMCDSACLMDRLCVHVCDSHYAKAHMYIDGFSDFTGQEAQVLEKLIRNGAEITLCLTCGDLENDEQEFLMQGAWAKSLRLQTMHAAEHRNLDLQTKTCLNGRAPGMRVKTRLCAYIRRIPACANARWQRPRYAAW